MNISESDDVLVERYREQRDEAAFKVLLERYAVPVHQLATSILGARFAAEADDVVQEVFVKVHHALHSFRGDAKFTTWLYRIAYHQSLSTKSQLSRRNAYSNSERMPDVVSDHGDPTATLDNAQLRMVLDAAINRLPTEYQVAVRMYYWLHVSVAEIASLSATSENTVKSYLRRSRKLLASYLDHQEENL